MKNKIIIAGAIFGMLGVMVGAFGAHGLKTLLVANGSLDTFEKGVSYQFYHALALILVGILNNSSPNKWLSLSAGAFIVGIVFFSGSLYALSLSGITIFGAIAPIGGTSFIIGWFALIWAQKKG